MVLLEVVDAMDVMHEMADVGLWAIYEK